MKPHSVMTCKIESTIYSIFHLKIKIFRTLRLLSYLFINSITFARTYYLYVNHNARDFSTSRNITLLKNNLPLRVSSSIISKYPEIIELQLEAYIKQNHNIFSLRIPVIDLHPLSTFTHSNTR